MRKQIEERLAHATARSAPAHDPGNKEHVASIPEQRVRHQKLLETPLHPRHSASRTTVQLAGDYDGLLPAHDVYDDDYAYAGGRSNEFTYHHIIPENKLIKVVDRLKFLIEHKKQQAAKNKPAPLAQSVNNMMSGAEEQWLDTRAKNTAHYLQAELPGLHVSEATLRSIFAKAADNQDLRDKSWALIRAQLHNLFRSDVGSFVKSIKVALNEEVFCTEWTHQDLSLERLNGLTKALPILRHAVSAEELRDILHSVRPKHGKTDKAELIERLKDSLTIRDYGAAVDLEFKPDLCEVVRKHGLPLTDSDSFADAITWIPGNIHRGPSSSKRIDPDHKDFDVTRDDGGNRFEGAARGVLPAKHFKFVNDLSTKIDEFLQFDLLNPLDKTSAIDKAPDLLDRMAKLRKFGLTAFKESDWQEEKLAEKFVMRVGPTPVQAPASGELI